MAGKVFYAGGAIPNSNNGTGGTTNYNDLTNLPSIEGVTVKGNITLAKLGLSTVYKYKGTVDTVSDLPSDAQIGDTYNVADTGANYSWNGTEWDKLSETIEIQASNVEYNNNGFTSVQEALDSLLYVKPSITTFTGGGTYELGSIINTVNLKWVLNKQVVSQSLNQGIGTIDKNLRNYSITDANISTNKTYTLTVSDGTNTASKSTTITFSQKRYWGVSESSTLTDTDILKFNQEFSTGKIQTRTFNCSGGKYFYFVIPTQYCNNIAFKVGGLAFSAMEVITRNVVNASGHTASYNIYRPTNIQTGSNIMVEVL